jgi:hypothetical protein
MEPRMFLFTVLNDFAGIHYIAKGGKRREKEMLPNQKII